MSAIRSIVIVGAGQSGFQAAVSLRDNGFDGDIRLIGNEPELPYQRPPLSKAYLLGTTGEEGLLFRPGKFFADKKISVLAGERAQSIDRFGKCVMLESGGQLNYDHLIFATGARNRRLADESVDRLVGLHYLRSVADARAIKKALGSARSAVVIGAGFIGLEFAAVASTFAIKVTVLDLAPRPLSRAVTPETSAFVAEQHTNWGVDIRCAVPGFKILSADGRVTGVELSSGERLPADVVLVGIGVLPNAEIAAESGLMVSNGIAVNAYLTTSDPRISAIGDCASFPTPHSPAPVRLESVQNAADQARALAATLTGRNTPYESVPWFWSDQRDMKLQIAGLTTGADNVVQVVDAEARNLAVFCFKGDTLLGVETVNQVSTHMAARRALVRKLPLRPAEVACAGFNLKAYEAAA